MFFLLLEFGFLSVLTVSSFVPLHVGTSPGWPGSLISRVLCSPCGNCSPCFPCPSLRPSHPTRCEVSSLSPSPRPLAGPPLLCPTEPWNALSPRPVRVARTVSTTPPASHGPAAASRCPAAGPLRLPGARVPPRPPRTGSSQRPSSRHLVDHLSPRSLLAPPDGNGKLGLSQPRSRHWLSPGAAPALRVSDFVALGRTL